MGVVEGSVFLRSPLLNFVLPLWNVWLACEPISLALVHVCAVPDVGVTTINICIVVVVVASETTCS